MQKNLGGDRLNSGKKMKVELHNYERSTHDLGYPFRTSCSAGTLVPFLVELGLPGDTFDINLFMKILTHPTIGPLFGSYVAELNLFMAPIRLYNSYLHNNMLNIGRNMSTIKIPQIEMTAIGKDIDEVDDIDNSQINPSSLLAYLGIRGIGQVDTVDESKTRQFNAIPILMYWDIYKNYFANKQEEIGAVIHTPSITLQTPADIYVDGTNVLAEDPAISNWEATDGTFLDLVFSEQPQQIIIRITPGGQALASELFINWEIITPGVRYRGYFDHARWGNLTLISWRMTTSTDIATGLPAVATFPLTYIDDMKIALLSEPGTNTFLINDLNKEPYKWLYESTNGKPNILSSQEGLALKTYKSDLFNAWLSTEWIDGVGGINDLTKIDTSGGSFGIDTLIMARKVYDLLNRVAVAGGSYDDWLDAVYVHERYRQCYSPMYMGGVIQELVFQEVISNSSSETEPLGTIAGRGTLADNKKGGNITIKVDEPCYIMGLLSLTPRVDYSQGNKWDIHLKNMDELHKPGLDQIGFQDLITEQMAWWDTKWDTTDWLQKSAGKQPAWTNYMTNVPRVLGNFAIANNEMFMTLNRRYEPGDTGIQDLTTYIDPSKFNHIFAETSLDSQNFWAQIGVDITARRKMSAKIMPNL